MIKNSIIYSVVPLITIFTPTFNRRNLLENLWNSLKNQKVYNFKWVIVDDGSTDKTNEYIELLINVSGFPIEYYYQQNSGKHIAHNLAVEKCNTELFYCVDSDDYLPTDSTEIIQNYFNAISFNKDVAGIVAYKAFFNGNIVGTKFPDLRISSLKQLYKLGKTGDTALIFKTRVLREFPFKKFQGEKFLRESTIYDLIDEKYKLLVVKEVLYHCEYLIDGLSNSTYLNEFKSPNGAALFRYMEYLKSERQSSRIRNLSTYIMFSIIAGKKNNAIIKIGIIKFILLLPLSLLTYLRLKYKIIINRKR